MGPASDFSMTRFFFPRTYAGLADTMWGKSDVDEPYIHLRAGLEDLYMFYHLSAA